MIIRGEDITVSVNPPYTTYAIALLYERADGAIFLPIQVIIESGIHPVTEENRDDLIERARIREAEHWPKQNGPLSRWEFMAASIYANLVREK